MMLGRELDNYTNSAHLIVMLKEGEGPTAGFAAKQRGQAAGCDEHAVAEDRTLTWCLGLLAWQRCLRVNDSSFGV